MYAQHMFLKYITDAYEIKLKLFQNDHYKFSST